MSKIRSLIYTLDIYNLQTRIVQFPNRKTLLNEVDNGQTCVFYECQYGTLFRSEKDI